MDMDTDAYSNDGEEALFGPGGGPGGGANVADVSMAFESQDWKETLERVVKTVVALRFALPSCFDGEEAMNSQATGFIVDAERG
jgi:hypothetical protein